MFIHSHLSSLFTYNSLLPSQQGGLIPFISRASITQGITKYLNSNKGWRLSESRNGCYKEQKYIIADISTKTEMRLILTLALLAISSTDSRFRQDGWTLNDALSGQGLWIHYCTLQRLKIQSTNTTVKAKVSVQNKNIKVKLKGIRRLRLTVPSIKLLRYLMTFTDSGLLVSNIKPNNLNISPKTQPRQYNPGGVVILGSHFKKSLSTRYYSTILR
ncbi:UNKNOWN [Stylonychia lemnae]|uniref:Uncharacterized protein n=1 Tax=Stylonychia lemnae TaxID=5949 RepID=A0A078AES2_STYLE|nr:UNKNOWN [Stylonychia lemnae]|eukprot:CDW79997.1 UNKNOWN [Stylonychia lemnae]